MKITKEYLRTIIAEELERLDEDSQTDFQQIVKANKDQGKLQQNDAENLTNVEREYAVLTQAGRKPDVSTVQNLLGRLSPAAQIIFKSRHKIS